MNNVGGGFLQGIIVAFVGLAALLPASYIMNRYIYHKPAMRLFMGVIAALSGLGGLVILLLLRLYNGSSMAIHYFGMLPVFPEVPPEKTDVEPTWLDWIGVGALQLVGEPLTFYYAGDKKDQDGYATTITNLMETFNTGKQTEVSGVVGTVFTNAVSEELFVAGRELGEMTTKGQSTFVDFINEKLKPDNYPGPTISVASDIGKALFSSAA